MSKARVPIKLTCIYAHKDAFFQRQLSSHLERLHLDDTLEAVQFMEVGEQAFAERRYTEAEREADIYLVLVSPHLLATPFMHSAFLRRVIAAHQYEQVRLQPLVIADGDYSKTILGKLKRLPSNEQPIKNEREFSLDANLTLLTKELKLVIIDWTDKKQEFLHRWQETQEEDKIQYYLNFLKDYPHSIYREAAQKRLNELREIDLWQTAQALDKVHQYYLYLRDAPLQENRAEAIERIAEIEQNESIGREDALQSTSLPMLFDFKVRFPRAAGMDEIREKIKQLVKDRINHLDEPEYIQTEAHYLQYLAYQKLNKDELLSMRLLLDYANHLLRRSKAVAGMVKSNQLGLMLAGFFGGMLAAYFLGPLIRYAMEGTFGFRPFVEFLLCVLGLFLMVRAYTGHRIARRDLAFCQDTTTALERSLVMIKVSSIDHDNRAIFQETRSLLRIESAHQQLAQGGLLTYLFDRSDRGALKQAEVIGKLPLPLK